MLDLQVRMMNRALKMKEAMVEKMTDERGDTNVVSVVIVLVIVVGLAAFFKDKIGGLINGIWDKAANEATPFVN